MENGHGEANVFGEAGVGNGDFDDLDMANDDEYTCAHCHESFNDETMFMAHLSSHRKK
jgi:hypothetical protein